MNVDEFRDSIAIYDEMLGSGERDPLSMLNIVDKRLSDISNHIALCHRVIAEQRALALLPALRAFIDCLLDRDIGTDDSSTSGSVR